MPHTPGPWEVHSNGRAIKARFGSIRCDDSELVPVMVLSSGVNLAGNASLIAAAPDLLDALKFALEQIEATGIPVPCNKIRAAIDKAEGR